MQQSAAYISRLDKRFLFHSQNAKYQAFAQYLLLPDIAAAFQIRLQEWKIAIWSSTSLSNAWNDSITI